MVALLDVCSQFYFQRFACSHSCCMRRTLIFDCSTPWRVVYWFLVVLWCNEMDSVQHIKIAFLMVLSVHVFRPEGQMWDPVRRDIKIYVQCLSNTPRIIYLSADLTKGSFEHESNYNVIYLSKRLKGFLTVCALYAQFSKDQNSVFNP